MESILGINRHGSMVRMLTRLAYPEWLADQVDDLHPDNQYGAVISSLDVGQEELTWGGVTSPARTSR